MQQESITFGFINSNGRVRNLSKFFVCMLRVLMYVYRTLSTDFDESFYIAIKICPVEVLGILSFKGTLRKSLVYLQSSRGFLDSHGTYPLILSLQRADSSLMDESDAICLRSTFPCILQPRSVLQTIWNSFVCCLIVVVCFVSVRHKTSMCKSTCNNKQHLHKHNWKSKHIKIVNWSCFMIELIENLIS